MRVGMIGCGHIGGVHSMALRTLHRAGLIDAPVVATHDVDSERAEAFAAAHPGCRAMADPAAVLDAVDVVWICTPTATHLPLVRAAATAGVDVFCEKPLATTAAGAAEMLEVVRNADVRHQVGLVLRSAPPFVTMRRLVTTDLLGRPMAAVLRDDQYFPIQGQYASTWRSDVAMAGGGTLIEHSIHDLDVLAWLLGPVREVSARLANYAGHEGIEDLAVATLAHDSGALSSLVSVWHWILSRPSTRRLEVFGERGLLWIDDERRGPVHVVSDGDAGDVDPMAEAGELPGLDLRDEWRLPLDAYLRADLAFLRHLADAGVPAGPGFDTALAAHDLADACYRSAAEGGAPVAVPAR